MPELLPGHVVEVGLEQQRRLARARPPARRGAPARRRPGCSWAGRRARRRRRRNPMAATVMAGSGPNDVDSAASERGAGRRRELHADVAPVGRAPPRAGGPSPAPGWAAGRGRCAPCPSPWRRPSARTSSTPSTSSAATVPTMSMMASCPPTSWKWTWSIGRRCSADSTSASRWNTARARCGHPGRQGGLGRSAPRSAPWVRTTTSSPPTMARVQATAAPQHRPRTRRSQPGRARRSSRRADLVDVGAGIDERAQRHVARDAGEAVEPGDRRRTVAGCAHGSSRAMAQAAPYPLSIPTTVMPDEQADSMASSAVTPSSAAPYPVLVGTATTGAGVSAAHHAGERALHAGDHDDRVGHGERVDLGEKPVQPGDPAVGEHGGVEPQCRAGRRCTRWRPAGRRCPRSRRRRSRDGLGPGERRRSRRCRCPRRSPGRRRAWWRSAETALT